MNIDLFKNTWCRETAHPSYQQKWSEDNPSCGQCAVTALIVNELCCAPIYKCKVVKENEFNYLFPARDKVNKYRKHYYYMWPGRYEVIDFTSEQFGDEKIDYWNGEPVLRSQLLKCKHVKERYELLKTKMEEVSYGRAV